MFIIDNEVAFNTEYEVAEYITDNIDSDSYDEMLNECCPTLNIGYITFYPSEILKKCDPIAYRCGMSDYEDSIRSDIVYYLERMNYGEEENFYGFNVELYEDEEE